VIERQPALSSLVEVCGDGSGEIKVQDSAFEAVAPSDVDELVNAADDVRYRAGGPLVCAFQYTVLVSAPSKNP
jgi:hypothetical protein